MKTFGKHNDLKKYLRTELTVQSETGLGRPPNPLQRRWEISPVVKLWCWITSPRGGNVPKKALPVFAGEPNSGQKMSYKPAQDVRDGKSWRIIIQYSTSSTNKKK